MPEPQQAAFITARPRFRVDGSLSDALAEATLNARAALPLNGRAHAELKFLNWGRDEGEAAFQLQELKLGSKLEIFFSEEDNAPQFAGEITAVEERYGDGAPQLVLLVEDKLHRLARTRKNRVFEDQSVDDVIGAIASEAGLSADAQVSSEQATWHQLNESNLAFLFRLLRPFDIALRLDGETLRARAEAEDASPVALDPQNNARRVRIIADLNHQPSKSQVKGWDLAADSQNDAESDALQPAPANETAAATLSDLGWDGEETLPHPFAASQGLADAWARGAFHRSGKRFLYGEVTCAGTPELSVGREVDLSGVSDRLRGRYQVVHCEHRYDNGEGYQTHVRVQRADWRV